MGEFFKRLFDSDLMPHGHCWQWEPWVVWTHVLSDSVITLSYWLIGSMLLGIRFRRKDPAFDRVLELFALFILACGCTHAMEVFNTWHGMFRFAGVVKVVTALVSFASMGFLFWTAPTLLRAPTLKLALGLDAALSWERRKKRWVEGELQETRDRFHLLVDAIRDYAIVMLGPDGRVNSWNPGAARLKGYQDHEILGQHVSRFYTPEDTAAGRPEAILRQAEAQGRSEDEGWTVRKDGTRFLGNSITTPFRDSQGNLKGFVSVTRDITEQRATQEMLRSLAENLEDKVKAQVRELRESEARLQGFIRHATTAIAFQGLDGRFLLINPKMELATGRPARDIVGRSNEDLFAPEVCAATRQIDEQVLQQRQESLQEEVWTHADGSRHDYLVHKFPLVDPTGQCWGMGIIGTDITERKQADAARLQSQKLESLGRLAGGIAHDFNNLLGAMQGNVELALAEGARAAARPYLETLNGLLSKGSGLLRQMLAYAGQGKSRVQVLDLNRTVEEMANLLGTSISKKAALQLDLARTPLPMSADPSQIQQVVMNLVLNASEALLDQSGVITLRTRRETLALAEINRRYDAQPLRPGRYVVLEVADTGVGMGEDLLKKIFDPFFTTKFAGRGLGLAAIQGIVRGHQGGIRVSSREGQGSVFKLLFPAARGAVARETREPLLAAGAPPEEGAQGTVLVVDDEEPMRNVVVQALERAGFQTLQARDGQEALGLYDEHRARIRLILMDLTMPNMDGEEACRELRRRGAQVPVILASGFSETDALRRFTGLGLAGFLQKPFTLGGLVERISKVLG